MINHAEVDLVGLAEFCERCPLDAAILFASYVDATVQLSDALGEANGKFPDFTVRTASPAGRAQAVWDAFFEQVE